MSNGRLHVKGIMFDLDGTILDTRLAYLEAAKLACEGTGQEVLPDALALEIPKRMEQWQPLTGLVKGDAKEFLHVYRRLFYQVSAAHTKPMPNVAQTLETLAAKFKLSVITMRFAPAHTVSAELKQFHLEKYLAHIVTSMDTKPKPNPDALIKAASAMNVQVQDCVIVGDSVIDVRAGKAAGSKTVAVLSGLYSRNELAAEGADFVLNTVNELPEILA